MIDNTLESRLVKTNNYDCVISWILMLSFSDYRKMYGRMFFTEESYFRKEVVNRSCKSKEQNTMA